MAALRRAAHADDGRVVQGALGFDYAGDGAICEARGLVREHLRGGAFHGGHIIGGGAVGAVRLAAGVGR